MIDWGKGNRRKKKFRVHLQKFTEGFQGETIISKISSTPKIISGQTLISKQATMTCAPIGLFFRLHTYDRELKHL